MNKNHNSLPLYSLSTSVIFFTSSIPFVGMITEVFADEGVIDTIGIGSNPFGVAYNSDNNDIYVTNSGSDTVSVIDGDTNKVTDTIGGGIIPTGIAYNSDNNDIYVTNSGSDTV
ncbi:MAG: hypothetical protein L0H53_14680, partial [Candidatus Nitrosocosmicus sp.]|nr:hypothetical protein [Candidatus Nitrosocosmicus sp.]MDN5868647.1 hypothetical protein [Candidatus Nitrosocosmicus sp.]